MVKQLKFKVMKTIYAKDLKAMKFNAEELEIAKEFANDTNKKPEFARINCYLTSECPSRLWKMHEVAEKIFIYFVDKFCKTHGEFGQYNFYKVAAWVSEMTGVKFVMVEKYMKGLASRFPFKYDYAQTLDLNLFYYTDKI